MIKHSSTVSKYPDPNVTPTKSDTPESWNIVPLWKRITSIVVGSDTINASYYIKDKWERSGSDYTLNLY